jgi:hypothetical protein
MKLSEQDLRKFAQGISGTIVIRTYKDGNSDDTRRKATKREQGIIESIVFGGLLAISVGNNHDAVISACEYIANLQVPLGNNYDNIYIPMQEWHSDNQ